MDSFKIEERIENSRAVQFSTMDSSELEERIKNYRITQLEKNIRELEDSKDRILLSLNNAEFEEVIEAVGIQDPFYKRELRDMIRREALKIALSHF